MTMLLRAAETLADSMYPEGSSRPSAAHAVAYREEHPADEEAFHSLVAISHDICSRLEREGQLAAQISQLPDALGGGDALSLLFRRLFPRSSTRPIPSPSDQSILSDREIELLQRSYRAPTYRELAAQLGISARTIEKHFQNIYFCRLLMPGHSTD